MKTALTPTEQGPYLQALTMEPATRIERATCGLRRPDLADGFAAESPPLSSEPANWMIHQWDSPHQGLHRVSLGETGLSANGYKKGYTDGYTGNAVNGWRQVRDQERAGAPR